MNILITGAAGFIASHLIEELLKNDENNIIGIDNLYSGTYENINFIKSLDIHNKFEFVEADIRDYCLINDIIKKNKINQVYHLAALVSVQESINDPLLSHDVNVRGTLNILEASKIHNVKRVVFSSSAAVYGDEPTLPKNEHSVIKPTSPYGYEKLIGEQYMELYSELYSLETVVLRYFNVYGERQLATSDYSGVISIFEDMFKKNKVPTIYGNGEQYRDFIYVKDIVQGNIQAMNTLNISGEVFCLGTGEKTSINRLFDIMNTKYSKEFQKQYKDSRNGDILESVCDNKKLEQLLRTKELTKFDQKILVL